MKRKSHLQRFHHFAILAFFVIVFSGDQLRGASLTHTMTVTDVQDNSGRKSVFIKKSPELHILPGTTFSVYRSNHQRPGLPHSQIPIALIKAQNVEVNVILAEVLAETSHQSKFFYPDYPGIMVGDRVYPNETKINRKVQLSPVMTLSYYELFIDPNRDPTTFELSETGKNMLRKVAEIYGSMRVPALLVEGYTDQSGPADANQIESYQRALTIRQFLINDFEFDSERVIAFGLGESAPLEEPYLPGQKEKARRIVFKVNQHIEN